MADPVADALTLPADIGRPAKPGGILAVVLPVAVLTLVALGGGAGVGWLVGGESMQRAEAALKPKKAAIERQEAAAENPDSPDTVVRLQTIISNIAHPSQIIVRLQGSLVLRKDDLDDVDVLASQVESDTLAFLRTVDLAQIEGARGLLHLKEDLTERAKLRSSAISDYLIESLVAQ